MESCGHMKWISTLFILFVLHSFTILAQEPGLIRMDQEGFYPHAPKIVIVAGLPDKTPGFPKGKKSFFVIRENSQDTVFHGELSEISMSRNSSLATRIADFSSFNRPGTYFVGIPDCGRSFVFSISENVHHPSALSSLKAFYYQRASMTLVPAYAGKWSRPAGHPDDSVIIHPSAASLKRQAGSVISTPGGWYDAGDYNKYIVNSGISTATLLSAYEDFRTYFDTIRTHIPSLPKPIPDILNEALYNLRWMLSMQDPEDGGVYNKCTNAAFDGMIMPSVAQKPRYVVQKGTAATLDFSAVAAQAARIFSSFRNELPGLSDSCLKAAEMAWNWAKSHPDLAYDQNAMNEKYEPKIMTGGYGDKKFSDELFWASAELLVTTGNKKYEAGVKKGSDLSFPLPSWSETGLLGYYSLLRNRDARLSIALKDSFRLRLLRMADEYINGLSDNAFRTVMGGRKSDFNWGSNSNAANQGILLVWAYRITKNIKYLEAALGNLEYILGRNATGYCFVTGIGRYSTMHPHHRPSVADGIDDPVPGWMAGGPNPGEQDHCPYFFHEPETAYVDSDCAYASNEIAINWNAPLVYLSNAMEALQYDFSFGFFK